MFCIYCGASNPDSASFCSACGKAMAVQVVEPAVPVQQQPQAPAEAPRSAEPPRAVPVQAAPAPSVPVPPRQRSHMLRNLALVAVLIAAVIVVAIALAGPSPKDSLEKAGTALVHQDAQAFDNYVDVQSVLDDWADQAASSWLANNNSSAGATLIANGLDAGFKTLIVPKLASSVEQEILGNRAADQPQSGDADSATNYMTSFVSSGIHSLITSQLSYQGVASQTKSGSDAVLDVRVGSPLSNSPFIAKVKMRLVGDHWRIVAIPDIAGLLAQLHPPPNAGSLSSQTDLRNLADVAKNPQDTAPQSPASVSSPPPPAETGTQQPDDDDPIGPGGFITPPTR